MDNDFELLLLKNQLCFPTYAAANKIVRRYGPLLKEFNLTYTQYIVMMVMWEYNTINEKKLVELLYLQSNTLTPLIRKLEQKGYVGITQGKTDKRTLIISLTKKGEELKQKAVNVPKALIKESWLTKEEAETYRKLLYKILNEGKEEKDDN